MTLKNRIPIKFQRTGKINFAFDTASEKYNRKVLKRVLNKFVLTKQVCKASKLYFETKMKTL